VLGDFEQGTKQALQNEAEKNSGAEFGVALQDLTPEIRKNMQIRTKTGALVVGVAEDSELSGLLGRGDVILEINRKNVKNVSDANKLLAAAKKKEGDIVFLIEREGINQLVVMRGR
jgi:S1-C subfamily serine protease